MKPSEYSVLIIASLATALWALTAPGCGSSEKSGQPVEEKVPSAAPKINPVPALLSSPPKPRNNAAVTVKKSPPAIPHTKVKGVGSVRERKQFTMLAVGDLMAQPRLLTAMEDEPQNWSRAFGDFAVSFAGARVAFGNLETPITHSAWSDAERKKNLLAPAPAFMAGLDMIRGLKQTGFTVLSVANNHILDQGPRGLARTLALLKAENLHAIGAAPGGESPLTVIDTGGFRVGFMAFAAFTNVRQKTFKLSDYTINFMNENEPSEVKRAAALVKKYRAGVDLLVVSVHWGWEFNNWPTVHQRRAATALMEGGADVILGHHPHVLQGADYYNTRRGVRGFVIYSMGNALSAMGIHDLSDYRKEAAGRNDSVVLTLTVTHTKGGAPLVEASYAPAFSLPYRQNSEQRYAYVDLRQEIERRKAAGTCMVKALDTCAALNYRLEAVGKIFKNLPLTSPIP
ncbi:CapA family protein [Myxococcota bacterium]|nr:CapA family protein [Myxococcota bacterium]MBU1537881.1 CapA family protein [Myxococcota bacterium]